MTDFHFTDRSGFHSIDAFASIQGKSYCVEVKVRDMSIGSYPSHILEAKKLQQFKDLAAEGHRGLFVLFCNDGVLVYNIAERLKLARDGEFSQLELTEMKLPANTMKDRGRTTKWVAHLSQSPQFKDKTFSMYL